MQLIERTETAKIADTTLTTRLFGVTTTTKSAVSLNTIQHTLTEDHSDNLHLIGKGFNIGGPFSSQKHTYASALNHVIDRYTSATPDTFSQVNGVRVPARFYQNGSGQYPAYPAPASDNDLNLWGTSGVSRTIPTNPLFNASQFIGELVQDVPELPTRQLFKQLSSKNAAGEYLNYEFGLKPTLSDLQKFVEANRKFEQRRKWLKANVGKKLRRRAELLHETNTTTSSYTEGLLPFLGAGAPSSRNQITVKVTTTTSRRVWFSGSYCYYYQEPPSQLLRNVDDIRRAYGVEITPQLVWELAPWSWLVDWKFNTGQVMANLSRLHSDGLVMQYGYIMCHQTVSQEHSFPPYGSITLVSETKQRAAGNPYGFALKPDAFSAGQWAILSALGLNRGGATRY